MHTNRTLQLLQLGVVKLVALGVTPYRRRHRGAYIVTMLLYEWVLPFILQRVSIAGTDMQ